MVSQFYRFRIPYHQNIRQLCFSLCLLIYSNWLLWEIVLLQICITIKVWKLYFTIKQMGIYAILLAHLLYALFDQTYVSI